MFRPADGRGWNRDEAPSWFIKGSYVLDVLYGRKVAGDIDVFYDRRHRRPTREEVVAWLQGHGWWVPNLVEIVGVSAEDFSTRDGGGEKRFNTDNVSISMDGTFQIIEASGNPRTASRETVLEYLNCGLSLLDGWDLPLPDPPGSPGAGGTEYLEKIKKKLTAHGELENVKLLRAVEARLTEDYEYQPEEGPPISTDLDSQAGDDSPDSGRDGT